MTVEIHFSNALIAAKALKNSSGEARVCGTAWRWRTIQQFPLNLPNQANDLLFLNLVHSRYIKIAEAQTCPITVQCNRKGLSPIRGDRISQPRNYLLYFICSDDKIKPGKPLSYYTPRFWKTLVPGDSVHSVGRIGFTKSRSDCSLIGRNVLSTDALWLTIMPA